MAEVIKDTGKNRSSNIRLYAGAVGLLSLIFSIGTCRHIKNSRREEYNKSISTVAQKTNRPIEEIQQYPSILVPQATWSELEFEVGVIAEKISLKALKVLVEDIGIIQRTYKSKYAQKNYENERKWTLINVANSGFVYDNSTGRIIGRGYFPDPANAVARGWCTELKDLRLEDYLTLHEKKDLDFFTMHAGFFYGLTPRDFENMPGKPNEDWFSLLQSAEVPYKAAVPQLLQGKKPEDIARIYTREKAATDYGLTLQDLVTITDPNESNFLHLKNEEIPLEYSLPLLQQGNTVEEIVETYSEGELCMSAEVRRAYRAIQLPGGNKLSDEQIIVFAANQITPQILTDVIKEDPYCVTLALSLAVQGKYNRKIHNEWKGFSLDDMFFALNMDWDTELARTVRDDYKKSLSDFYQDLLREQIQNDFFQENPERLPVLEGVR